VRCLEDCEILELRREVLAELIRDHPSIAETLRAAYEQRVLAMVIATCDIFQAVSPEDRLRVVGRFATVRRGPGEVVVQQGGKSSHFYVILVGEVVVSCEDEQGGSVEVARLTEGDYFGEMALISGYRAEATVRTLRTTELLALEDRDFYELASTHPEIWAEIQRASDARKAVNARLLAARKAEALLL
jgi:CRP-like cAMP-binding protein